MAKIDSEELIKRIEKIDSWHYDSAEVKWMIIMYIMEMAKEEKDDK